MKDLVGNETSDIPRFPKLTGLAEENDRNFSIMSLLEKEIRDIRLRVSSPCRRVQLVCDGSGQFMTVTFPKEVSREVLANELEQAIITSVRSAQTRLRKLRDSRHDNLVLAGATLKWWQANPPTAVEPVSSFLAELNHYRQVKSIARLRGGSHEQILRQHQRYRIISKST